MKQIVIAHAGGPEVLQLKETTTPKPAAGELQINVRAAGINFADIVARKGLYPDAPKIPCVVGYEVAGIVAAVGDGVEKSWVDKPVVALTRFGGYADTVNVPADQVFEKPASLSFEQAAGLPVVYLTAWQLLVVMGSLQPGEIVLVHNAGSGVGLAALDIIKHFGGKAIGTASAHKHDLLRERGYHFLIDPHQQDWFSEVMAFTKNHGVELVLDPIGGANWKKSYAALSPTGRLGMYGVSSLAESGNKYWRVVKFLLTTPRFGTLDLLNKNRGVFGVNLGHLWQEKEKVMGWMRAILAGVNEGWIFPHVDRTFTFEEAAAAHRYVEARLSVGKVILAP